MSLDDIIGVGENNNLKTIDSEMSVFPIIPLRTIVTESDVTANRIDVSFAKLYMSNI